MQTSFMILLAHGQGRWRVARYSSLEVKNLTQRAINKDQKILGILKSLITVCVRLCANENLFVHSYQKISTEWR